MPSSIQHGYLREAAILTRAVENVVRKLVRLLIGRISLTRLQEMLRFVFVQEAEAFLQRERPGKNVPMTKLALLTGLDTRTLGRVKEEASLKRTVHESNRFLREITPECSILDYWQVNPKYLNADDGQPLELAIKGESPSFESLVSDTLTSRGITTKSLLERLESSRAIHIDAKANTVRMLDKRFWPFQQEDDTAMLEIGLIATGNLIETVEHNVQCKGDKSESFFQRATWTHRLNRKDQMLLRARIRKILSESELTVSNVLGDFEENEASQEQLTAGVCLFYFEEDPKKEDY